MIRNLQHNLDARGFDLAEDGIAGPKTWAAMFQYMANWPMGDRAKQLGAGAATAFPAYAIDSPLRVANWFGQWTHETQGFRKFEESLSYSAKRMCEVWPSRFPTLDSAEPYALNPAALAERTYGGRMGNIHPGDGWLYRGRGPQLTGRENYTACAVRTGLDLVQYPELAARPENFASIACDFWGAHCLNALADLDDIEGITRKVNGGLVGIAERKAYRDRALKVLLP